MGRKRSLEVDNSEGTEQAVATEKEVEVEEPEKLSLRDSLEVALEAEKDDAPPTEKAPEEKEEIAPEKKELESPRREPPSEWTKEEKEDFRAATPKQQEAILRVHSARVSQLEELKREKAELEWIKDLEREVTPYLKAMGETKPTHEALKLALQMKREFDTGNPEEAAAAYLKARGRPIPRELIEAGKAEGNIPEKVIQEKIAPLQEEIQGLKQEIVREKQQKAGEILGSLYESFEQEKNAAGTLRFPDASGLEMASNIGSLVSGQTDLSKQFIANVSKRIPNLTYPRLLEEAYRYYGGAVDDSEATRSQDSQKHISKSNRAASSVPGRGAQSVAAQSTPKKLPLREALKAAVSDLREAEGV